LLERPERVDAAVNFGSGYYLITAPVAVGVQRHEFNEAHD
jgi:hypothetical protein